MMEKNKTLRAAFSGVLMLTVVAAGVTMYRSETGNEQTESRMEEDIAAKEKEKGKETEEKLSRGQKDAMQSGNYEKDKTTDVTVDDAQAENYQKNNQKEENNPEDPTQETGNPETAEKADKTEDTEDTAAAVQPELTFTEDSILEWPVQGQVLIDYSMDAATYFQTLDQYKYNDTLILQAAVGDPVNAAAKGQVTAISENAETGTTVTMDLGNGYQASYGQLKDLTVKAGQTVEAGTIIGYVSAPTRYYVKEGPNVAFTMTKDGKPADPMIYMETAIE